MPLSNALLKISDEEWAAAESYFAQDFSKNPHLDPTKMSKQKGSNKGHSFIKVGDEIFALANRKCFGEEKHGLLGEGSFGKVKVVQSRNGENFAVKVEGRGPRGEHDAETKIMKAIGFSKGEAVRNLKTVKNFKGQFTQQKLYTVMKLREGKELHEYIYLPSGYARPDQLSSDQKLLAALSSCKAVQELHDKGIIHADLKPANLMAKIDGSQILVSSIDFGFSMQLQSGKNEIWTPGKGSQPYIAPEIYPTISNPNGCFSFASDIYALGVMFQKDLRLDPAICNGMLQHNRHQRDDMDKVMLNLITKLKQSPTLDTQNRVMIAQLEQNLKERENKKLELITAQFEQTIKSTKDMNSFLNAIHNAPRHLTDSNGNKIDGPALADKMYKILNNASLVAEISNDPSELLFLGVTSNFEKHGIRNNFLEIVKSQHLKNTFANASDEKSLLMALNNAPIALLPNKERIIQGVNLILNTPHLVSAIAANPIAADHLLQFNGISGDYGINNVVKMIAQQKYQEMLKVQAQKQEQQRMEAQVDLKQKITQASSIGLDEVIKVIREHPAPILSRAGQAIDKEEEIRAILNLRNPQPGVTNTIKVTSNYDLEGIVNRLITKENEAKLMAVPKTPVMPHIVQQQPIPFTPPQITPPPPPTPTPMDLVLRTVIAQKMHGTDAINFSGKKWEQITADVNFAGLKSRYMVSLGSSTTRERLFIDRESSSPIMVNLREKIQAESKGKSVPEILAIVNKYIDALTTEHPYVRGQSRDKIENELDGRLEKYLNDRAVGGIIGKPANRDVDIDELANAGILVCRHKGLLAASIMGQLIDNKILPPGAARQYRSEIQNTAGRTIGAHTWSVYRDGTTGDLWVNDPRWAHVKKVDPNRMSDIGYGIPAVRQMIQRLSGIDAPILKALREAKQRDLPQPPIVQAPIVQAPIVQAPIVQAPIVQPPIVQTPIEQPKINKESEPEHLLKAAIMGAKSTAELIDILKKSDVVLKRQDGSLLDKEKMLENLVLFSTEPYYIQIIAKDRTIAGHSPFAGSEITGNYEIRTKFIELVKAEFANKLVQGSPIIDKNGPEIKKEEVVAPKAESPKPDVPIEKPIDKNEPEIKIEKAIREILVDKNVLDIRALLNKLDKGLPPKPEALSPKVNTPENQFIKVINKIEEKITPPENPIRKAIEKIEETRTWVISPKDKRNDWLKPLLSKLENLDRQNLPTEEKVRILQEEVTKVYLSAGSTQGGYNAKSVAQDILTDILKVMPPEITPPKVVQQNDSSISRIINLKEKDIRDNYHEIRNGNGALDWARVKAKNFGQAIGDKGHKREELIKEMAKVFEHLKNNPSPANSFKTWSYLAEVSRQISNENNKMESALSKMCNNLMKEIDPQNKFLEKRFDQIQTAYKECKEAVNTENKTPMLRDPHKKHRN